MFGNHFLEFGIPEIPNIPKCSTIPTVPTTSTEQSFGISEFDILKHLTRFLAFSGISFFGLCISVFRLKKTCLKS